MMTSSPGLQVASNIARLPVVLPLTRKARIVATVRRRRQPFRLTQQTPGKVRRIDTSAMWHINAQRGSKDLPSSGV